MPDQGILVSDFDGTITRFDFYDLVCRAFPDIAGGYWQQYERGEITHFEALQRIFAGIRSSEEQMMAIVEAMQVCPRFKAHVHALRLAGWETVVASAGCDWYIRRLLAGQDVAVRVHANPGVFTPQDGLLMRLPEPSPFLSLELGVNKVAVVRDALETSVRVAFAGDGRPDLAPALLVPPTRRFAKGWLARKLQEIGEAYQPFDEWSQVAEALLKEGGL